MQVLRSHKHTTEPGHPTDPRARSMQVEPTSMQVEPTSKPRDTNRSYFGLAGAPQNTSGLRFLPHFHEVEEARASAVLPGSLRFLFGVAGAGKTLATPLLLVSSLFTWNCEWASECSPTFSGPLNILQALATNKDACHASRRCRLRTPHFVLGCWSATHVSAHTYLEGQGTEQVVSNRRPSP